MQFNDAQLEEIQDLQTRGFSQNLAEMTLAAKSAGYESAVDVDAGIVKVLTGQEKSTKADVACKKKKLQDELAALEKASSLFYIQRRISLKRQLSELGKAA